MRRTPSSSASILGRLRRLTRRRRQPPCCRQGTVALRRGQMHTAARWLREAAGAIARRVRLPASHGARAPDRGVRPRRRRRRRDAASTEADDLVDHAPLFESQIEAHEAWPRSAHGQRTAASELALNAAAWCAAHDQAAGELGCLHNALRLGADRQVAQQIVVLAPEIEGPWASGIAAHAAPRYSPTTAPRSTPPRPTSKRSEPCSSRRKPRRWPRPRSARGLLARSERSATRARCAALGV